MAEEKISYEKYAERLLAELDLENLPIERKEKILGQIRERIEERIFQVILGGLSESDAAELSQKIDQGMSQEEATKWTAEKVPNLSEKIENVLLELRGELLEVAREIKKE